MHGAATALFLCLALAGCAVGIDIDINVLVNGPLTVKVETKDDVDVKAGDIEARGML